MESIVLDIINSYEERLLSAERLIACEASLDSDESLSRAWEERARLKADLREMLARSYSLRYKDFDRLMGGILEEMDARRLELEKERGELRRQLAGYLNTQRQLALSLKEELVVLSGGSEAGAMEALMVRMRVSFREDGESTLARLHDFQQRVTVFCQEYEQLNQRLNGALQKCRLLEVKDVRAIEAARERSSRRTERRTRQEHISHLLADFREERRRSA